MAGIDVAPATVAVAVSPEGRTRAVTTQPAALARLARELHALAPALVVLEGTGGLQRPVVAALVACAHKLLIILNAIAREQQP